MAEDVHALPPGIEWPRERTLRTFTAADLEGLPVPERIWHAAPLIPGRTVTLLGGDGGLGKSTLGLQLCCATALGDPWLSRPVRQGRTLYLGAEDDADELHRRLDQIAFAMDVPLSALGGVRAASLADQDALLVTGKPGEALKETPLFDEVRELAQDWGPRLIVLDSAADVFGANENDRGQVRQFIGKLRALALAMDAAVVLLSHPSRTGMDDGTGQSGSTHWNNSVRSRLYLERPKGLDVPDPDLRVLKTMKANYAPAGGELQLRYAAGAFILADDGQPLANPVMRAREIDALFLDLLREHELEGRTASHMPGANYAPARFAEKAKAKAQGVAKRGFQQAMERLFASGAIRVETEGRPSKERQRLVQCGEAKR